MDKIKYIVATILIGVVCFSIGKFSSPAKVQIKEVEKVVYRERKDSKSNSDRTTSKKETVLPDGTKITETNTNSKKTSETHTDTESTKETSKETKTTSRPDWRVGLTYFPAIHSIQDKVFIMDIQKNIISELYLGVSISTQKTIGFSFSIGI